MRTFRKAQNGVTLVTLVAILALFALLALFILKLAPIYIDNAAVSSVLENLKSDSGDIINRDTSKGEIIQTIRKRLDINNVQSVFDEDIQIIREPNYVIITIEYEVRTAFVANIDLAVYFTESVEVDIN